MAHEKSIMVGNWNLIGPLAGTVLDQFTNVVGRIPHVDPFLSELSVNAKNANAMRKPRCLPPLQKIQVKPWPAKHLSWRPSVQAHKQSLFEKLARVLGTEYR